MKSKVIGMNVKKYRRTAGFTQEHLAERLEISTVHMSHIECGHVSMSLDILLKLCSILSVTPNQLLDGAYDTPPGSDKDWTFEGMSDDTKLLAYRILALLRQYSENKS